MAPVPVAIREVRQMLVVGVALHVNAMNGPTVITPVTLTEKLPARLVHVAVRHEVETPVTGVIVAVVPADGREIGPHIGNHVVKEGDAAVDH